MSTVKYSKFENFFKFLKIFLYFIYNCLYSKELCFERFSNFFDFFSKFSFFRSSGPGEGFFIKTDVFRDFFCYLSPAGLADEVLFKPGV